MVVRSVLSLRFHLAFSNEQPCAMVQDMDICKYVMKGFRCSISPAAIVDLRRIRRSMEKDLVCFTYIILVMFERPPSNLFVAFNYFTTPQEGNCGTFISLLSARGLLQQLDFDRKRTHSETSRKHPRNEMTRPTHIQYNARPRVSKIFPCMVIQSMGAWANERQSSGQE